MHFDIGPLRLIIIGFTLLAASWFTLLLMVIGQIPKHLILSLAAYAISVAGLAVGLFGVVVYVRRGTL